MMLFTLCESMMPANENDDDSDASRGVPISIYPITSAQWQALQDVAASKGIDRSALIREAIGLLLDERDRDTTVRRIYPAAPRLTSEEKADTNPRALWVPNEMADRIKQRYADDRVQPSELYLEAIRSYLDAEGITTDPPF
jgi:Arc/MetJ-type ribon-helix-helix transcriptional regulator